MEKKVGFYCWMYGRDCFIVTDQTRRTKTLALDFINKVQNATNRFNNIDEKSIGYIQGAMLPATFEIKTIQIGNHPCDGLKYYKIDGGNFSYCCDACENPMEHCILV